MLDVKEDGVYISARKRSRKNENFAKKYFLTQKQQEQNTSRIHLLLLLSVISEQTLLHKQEDMKQKVSDTTSRFAARGDNETKGEESSFVVQKTCCVCLT